MNRQPGYILAIDQGTTGTTTILYDDQARIVRRAYREFPQIYPKPGWVEHDPVEIWKTVVDTVEETVSGFDCKITAAGITNQRETTILWDKKTGRPVHNAIVWQCRRTADYCNKLREHEELFKKRTGLPLDAYFSATKIKWILNNVSGINLDSVLFGTVDSWIIWKLTGGRVHAIDYTNASRTLLFNIIEKKWDVELCKIMGVPPHILPQTKKPADNYGKVTEIATIKEVPILAVLGDQQAALFGQACFEKGSIKNTYGTGCFVMMNTGSRPVFSRKGLITTLAADSMGEPCYALEGSIFIAGAAIQWLRDELKILDNASDSEAAADELEDNGGVYLVPAFTGLGAPHWDMHARGIITGITRGTNRNNIIRAALESMAYQTYDVISAMEAEMGGKIPVLAVDGGASVNNFLMQLQADILNKSVLRPAAVETTAQGAAYLAGLKAGVWKDTDEIKRLKKIDREFKPCMSGEKRRELLDGWNKALRQAVVK
ncbi:MAG: glycerol kinase GlpK [bacterium]